MQGQRKEDTISSDFPTTAMTSLEEKLAIIDQEIRTLHQFCVNQGFNPQQVERCAEPLLKSVAAARTKRRLTALYKVSLVVVVLAALLYYDPVHRTLCSYGRLAAIQVLPLWDWTTLHGRDCLVENPYFVGNKLTMDDCEVCEHLESIQRIHNVSHPIITEDFLKRDIPAIVTDAVVDWPAQELFSIPFLSQLYGNEEALQAVMPCMFASNVRVKQGNAKAILAKAARGEITNWYAHWENCEKNAAKTLRQFYTRPYFIPPMVEMAEPNWVFVAFKYKGKRSKPADIALPLMWIALLKGQMKVTLVPRSPCNSTCSTLYNTLHEGETLVVTDMMWLLDYMPQGEGETIAIGSGGFFD